MATLTEFVRRSRAGVGAQGGGRPALPPGEHKPRRRFTASLSRRRTLYGYALLTPAVLFVLLLIAYPLVLAIRLALTPGRFAGLNNLGTGISTEHLIGVLTSPQTLHWLSLTGIYVVGTITPAFCLGLAVALFLHRPFRGRRWFRSLILLPWAVPGVAASAVFLWMADGAFGVINKLLLNLQLIDAPVAWYSNPRTAMLAVIMPTAWKLFPFFAMILLASLQTVPHDLYESANVDGAGPVWQFRAVTWPGIRGAAFAGLMIATLGVYREFDFIYPLTRGGPGDSTTTMAISIYVEAFQLSNMGFAAALGVVSTLIAGIFVLFGGRKMSRVNV